MSQKQRFYLYSSAIGLDRAEAERRAVNRLVDVFEFSEITEEQFNDLNQKLVEILNKRGIAIPTEEAVVEEKPTVTLIEDMSIDEIRNMLKPCDHEWNDYVKESNDFDTLICKECTICGAVALAIGLKPGIPCHHPSAMLVAKSPTKYVSVCYECGFWLVEPMRSRVSS